ncbi:hypothetical protein HYR99_33610 [Candidatus Poribacteria bacterium]|nr:hypothetical protein [Candidatus Poribacteria bacterium]
MKKTKWFIYTVVVGLIPFLIRSLLFLVVKDKSLAVWIHETDFIALGLVLNITNINELEHNEALDKSWKTVYMGTSILFIILLAVLFAVSCFHEINNAVFNLGRVKVLSIIMSIVSGAFSYAVYDRLIKTTQDSGG